MEPVAEEEPMANLSTGLEDPSSSVDGNSITTTTTVLADDADKDSAIDLSKEIEDLGKLQMSLDRMLDCAQSPSSSGCLNSTSSSAVVNLAARRLIRVPCASTPSTIDVSSDIARLMLPFTVSGGASEAKLIIIDKVRRDDLIGILTSGDRLMAIDEISISGMARSEVMRLLGKVCFEREQIALEILPANACTDDIREILANRDYAELQTVIRDNLYVKTVPYTTRPPRDGEVDGEHYRFVTTVEFNRLLSEGELLEHGTYQGHLYGTPRPLEDAQHLKQSELSEQQMVASARNILSTLPPSWEIGYTENGEKYFIDHNTGTTTWDDPRNLPDGWEQVLDPDYGVFYVDHVNRRTQYEHPSLTSSSNRYDSQAAPSFPFNNTLSRSMNNGHIRQSPPITKNYSSTNGNSPRQYFFTRDPNQLMGDLITTTIVKGPKGLGFTLIGNDSSSNGDEFIQVKSILSGGPAAENGQLEPGDILVRVNGQTLLGATQSEACRVFLNIAAGDPVAIQVCRGYPLLQDPSHRIITENAYTMQKPQRELIEIDIYKGADGFGFKIADSPQGQRVKKILFPSQCPNLMEGDTIVELDGRNIRSIPHQQLVDMLHECPVGHRGRLVVRRSSPKHRSRTPTAAFRYGEQQRTTPLPSLAPRSKTPAPAQRDSQIIPNGTDTVNNNNRSGYYSRPSTLQRQNNLPDDPNYRMRASSTTLGFATTPNYMPLSSFQTDLVTVNLIRKPMGFGFRLLGGRETSTMLTVGQIVPGGAANEDGRLSEGDEIIEIDGQNVEGATHSEAVALLEQAARNKHVKMVIRRPKSEIPQNQQVHPAEQNHLHSIGLSGDEFDVILNRQDSDGFGFIILSSLHRNGSTIGQILDNSPAARCGKLKVGDRVIAVNGINILNMSHGDIVNLIKTSGLSVRLTIVPSPETPLATSTLNRPSINPPAFKPTSNYSTIPSSNYAQYSTLPSTNNGIYSEYGRAKVVSVAPGQTPSYHQIQQKFGALNFNEQDGPLINVELERGTRGFGFSIRGGQEFGAMPLFVLRIAEDGPAAHDGRLKVGDQLIAINGKDTKGMTHDEAIQLIKLQPVVRLTVRRLKVS
ncbi:unnamed protein product [Auanema sp. JU1783]|nr:unnamed protein product [Auanema sp. JU1783]